MPQPLSPACLPFDETLGFGFAALVISGLGG
jgi:hypothetical protein